MHFNRRMMALSAVALSQVCMTCYTANAVDAPTDVHLTVETKEIAIEDIPGDRVVTLNIYLENCPPFNTMLLNVLKDSRLEFYSDQYRCFGIADGVSHMSQPQGRLYRDEDDYSQCGICSDYPDLVEYGNAIVTVSFRLPEQVSAGDFFSVELPRSYRDNSVDLSFTQETSERLGDAPFTQLNGGGIRITQREQPAPQPADNGGGGGDTGGNQGGGGVQSGGGDPQTGGNTASQDNNTAAAETTVTAETVVTTTQQSSTSSAKPTTTKTETTTTETTSTTTETSSSTSSQRTIAALTTGAPEEPEKKNSGGLLTIGIITIVVAAVSSLTILAARLRMNRK